MKLEGEYAVDKSEKYHRIASLIFVVVWIGWFSDGGMIGMLKSKGYIVIPLFFIWFPDVMASRFVSYWFESYSATGSVVIYYRWVGWCILLMPIIIPLVVRMIFQ
jgi:hypothetical protein